MNLNINSNMNFVNFRKILTLALGFLLFEGVSAMQSSKSNSGLTERQRYIVMIAADTAAGDFVLHLKELECRYNHRFDDFAAFIRQIFFEK